MESHVLRKDKENIAVPHVKVPPQNIEAEQSLLGSLLLSAGAIPEVVEFVHSEDFYVENHSRVYSAILYLYANGQPVDAITVAEKLKTDGDLERIGGKPFLHTLINMVPTAANAKHYGRIVEKNSTLRSLISTATQIVERSYATGIDEVDELLDESENMVYSVAHKRTSEGFVSIKDLLPGNFEQIEKLYEKKAHVTGLATGFNDFDELTSGLQPSNLIILAARPSMGKTSLAMNIAANVGMKQKVPVAIFSLEMSENELTQRLLCAEARVNSQYLRTGRLQDDDWSKLSSALGRLAEAPIFIDDSGQTTVMEMRAKARRLKHKHGLGLIIVDYLQLMYGSSRRNENRQQEISEISRSLKVLGRELEVPVIAVSQLSRAVEQRGGEKKPMLSDLRDSGAIEQDADLVVFIYREDYYNDESDAKGEAEIIVAKHRNGPTGTIRMTFLENYARFASIASGSPMGQRE